MKPTHIVSQRKSFPFFIKAVALVLCFSLLFEQSGFAQVADTLDISARFSRLINGLTQERFRPVHLRYLDYDNQANHFKLLLDKGDSKETNNQQLEDTTKNLLKYFAIGVSLPNESFWVNLRPDSPERIIDPLLAQTDIGRIFLEADLQLKKDTAAFTSPQMPEGKEYWDKLYKKAEEIYGYENVSIPTLTRPWIVPGEIVIKENYNSAYIYKATLRVRLEQDRIQVSDSASQAEYSFKDERAKALNEYSTQLIREIIIPRLTREVNNSKRYSSLRQVYYSLILAQWFKQRFYSRGGFYSWLINKGELEGLLSQEPWSPQYYFQEYQKSFKTGEYNIKEQRYTPYGQIIRSYFSGGIDCGSMLFAGSYSGSPVRPEVKVIPASGNDSLQVRDYTVLAEVSASSDIRNVKINIPAASQEIKISQAEQGQVEESSSPVLINHYNDKNTGKTAKILLSDRFFSQITTKAYKILFSLVGICLLLPLLTVFSPTTPERFFNPQNQPQNILQLPIAPSATARLNVPQYDSFDEYRKANDTNLRDLDLAVQEAVPKAKTQEMPDKLNEPGKNIQDAKSAVVHDQGEKEPGETLKAAQLSAPDSSEPDKTEYAPGKYSNPEDNALTAVSQTQDNYYSNMLDSEDLAQRWASEENAPQPSNQALPDINEYTKYHEVIPPSGFFEPDVKKAEPDKERLVNAATGVESETTVKTDNNIGKVELSNGFSSEKQDGVVQRSEDSLLIDTGNQGSARTPDISVSTQFFGAAAEAAGAGAPSPPEDKAGQQAPEQFNAGLSDPTISEPDLLPVDIEIPPELAANENLGTYYKIIRMGKSNNAGNVNELLSIVCQFEPPKDSGFFPSILPKLIYPLALVTNPEPALNAEVTAGNMLSMLESGALHLLALGNEFEPSNRIAAWWALGELKPVVGDSTGVSFRWPPVWQYKRWIIDEAYKTVKRKNEDPLVIAAALRTIALYDAKSIIGNIDLRLDALNKCIQHDDWVVRYYAGKLLAAMDDLRAIESINRFLLKEDNPYVIKVVTETALKRNSFGVLLRSMQAMEKLKFDGSEDQALYALDSQVWNGVAKGLTNFVANADQPAEER
ncbi:MAG: HEAT repeat domain-containing protein, partial [Candidatus Omnitrophica bacterium]|nr:HEAT repeat domain-containing protein [Candidatus Omnitrophota bacterium]